MHRMNGPNFKEADSIVPAIIVVLSNLQQARHERTTKSGLAGTHRIPNTQGATGRQHSDARQGPILDKIWRHGFKEAVLDETLALLERARQGKARG